MIYIYIYIIYIYIYYIYDIYMCVKMRVWSHCKILTAECPVGLSCENLVPGHYRRFTHHLMACHLAGKSLPGSTG